jgi:hypothetical protein
VEWSFVLTRCCSRVVSGLSAADRRGFERLHPRVEDFYSRFHHHVLLQGVKIFLLLDGLSGLLVDEFLAICSAGLTRRGWMSGGTC